MPPSRRRRGAALIVALFSLIRPAAPGQSPAPEAGTYSLSVAPWEKTVSLPAEATPYYRVVLGTSVTGWIDAVEADIGARVEKGDILAKIRAPDLVSARAARAEEARAAEQAVAGARAMLASAEAEAKAAESEFVRLRRLAADGTVTGKARDEAEARASAAVARVSESEARVAVAGADALAAKARVAEAEALLEYTRVVAPFDGLVVGRRAELGDFLASGAEGAGLFTVEQTDPLRVRIHVPEHAAALVRPGQQTRLSLAGREFEVELARVSGSLDPVTRTLAAEADLAGSDLLPGTFGTATMTLASLESAALVPLAAIRTGADGSRHLVVVEGEGRRNLPVTLHATEGGRGVVTGDLATGMTVLVP